CDSSCIANRTDTSVLTVHRETSNLQTFTWGFFQSNNIPHFYYAWPIVCNRQSETCILTSHNPTVICLFCDTQLHFTVLTSRGYCQPGHAFAVCSHLAGIICYSVLQQSRICQFSSTCYICIPFDRSTFDRKVCQRLVVILTIFRIGIIYGRSCRDHHIDMNDRSLAYWIGT